MRIKIKSAAAFWGLFSIVALLLILVIRRSAAAAKFILKYTTVWQKVLLVGLVYAGVLGLDYVSFLLSSKDFKEVFEKAQLQDMDLERFNNHGKLYIVMFSFYLTCGLSILLIYARSTHRYFLLSILVILSGFLVTFDIMCVMHGLFVYNRLMFILFVILKTITLLYVCYVTVT
jgi:hypothetical protein